MNKAEVEQAMNAGKTVRHDSFDHDEYIYKIDGTIYDENDFKMEILTPNGVVDFWTDRQGPEWNEGWSIVTQK